MQRVNSAILHADMFVSDPNNVTQIELHIRLSVVAELELAPGSWNILNLRASHWRLYAVDRAGGWMDMADGAVTFLPQHVYIVPAGAAFNGGNDSTFLQSFIHFDVVGMPHFSALELFSKPTELSDSTELCARVRDICARRTMSQGIDLVTQVEAKGVVYESLARFLRDQPSDVHQRYWNIAASVEAVLPALRHVEHNLGSAIVNAHLASLCHMSEGHFMRLFRKCMKITPGQYAQERRVGLASQMLMFTNKSIDQIATECGFGNRYYLTRVFSRHAGIGPAAYRSTVRR